MNKETIGKINEAAETYLKQAQKTNVRREFEVDNLQFTDSGKIYLEDLEVTKRAKNKILSLLKVRPQFTKYANSMDDGDWTSIAQKLKGANGKRKLIAEVTDNGKINNIFTTRTKKHTDVADLRGYFDMINDSLKATKTEYEFGSLNFNGEKSTFDLNLMNRNTDIDIFGNSDDKWNGGCQLTFNELAFNTQPFFERLICANGMRAKQHGFASNVQQAKFNMNRIKRQIQKAIEHGTENIHEIVTGAGQHLNKHNVSLNEFYEIRNWLLQQADPVYTKIVGKYFDDKPFYRAYQTNIAEKSKKWRATANSGINAYDFFNLITWVGTHENGINDSQTRELQLKASNLFFKKDLDLEDIATNIKVDYPRLAVMA